VQERGETGRKPLARHRGMVLIRECRDISEKAKSKQKTILDVSLLIRRLH
jgi:hypothetical protein